MFFFFQAEDGIRDGRVTGVQTCALPISRPQGLRDVNAVSFNRNNLGFGKYPQPDRKREGVAGILPAPWHAETANPSEGKSHAEELDVTGTCQKVANIQFGPLDRLVAAPKVFVERSRIVP